MTRFRGTQQETRALSTFVKLMRASESVAADVHRQLPGLSVSQFGILEALYHLGPMSQKELGKQILKSAGNITMVIDNLEKQDLVERSRNPDDRRLYIISLTEKGTQLIRTIFPEHSQRIQERLSRLTSSEQKTLGRLLKKLGSPISIDKEENHAQKNSGS